MRQPWQRFVFNGDKRIENRSWPLPKWLLRQWIALYTPKKIDSWVLHDVSRDVLIPVIQLYDTFVPFP